METKILLLLLPLIMEICSKTSALHSLGSSEEPTIPSRPYPTYHTPYHVSRLTSGQKRRRHGKPAAAPPRRKKLFQPIPAKAANPDDQSIAIPPSTSYQKHHHHHYHHHHRRNDDQLGPSMSPTTWSPPALATAPSPATTSGHFNLPSFSPAVSPSPSIVGNREATPPSPIMSLPPPPPNTDCSSVTCTEPLTYTPAGWPCGCVEPIQVKLRLDVAVYAFFPLVSKLAEEVAAGVALRRSQVRIMGADAATQQLEKTTVIVNLVPTGVRFDYFAAFRIYDKFWRRQVPINDSIFGDYKVLYVHYPGLPPSPPPAPFSISTVEDGPYIGHGMPMKPLGVDVVASGPKRDGLGKRMIAVIAVSSLTAFVVLLGAGWILLVKLRSRPARSGDNPHALIPSATQKPKPKPTRITTGTLPMAVERGRPGSRELVSLSSGTMTYTGSAKIFTLSEMERATEGFEASRVLGEGGFGLVYSGTLDDGREVAVKVLKRGDHQGGREFLAEVEMLSRLHHRNLVKLMGICSEGQTRCLVYELVPNGSVESHLHGVDKEADPLDWDARMKIALGAARGLAYLHEDSNPRVIHRDFKSSNILLEHDFTPKVSDFGLARAALEGDRHISTHVMGTFGYLAPEYAMTGHLLVKSDVYSYGVVLLELLTGRKPVDLSQPPGQENLVAWVRPLLTNREALESIIDPSFNCRGVADSAAKVAAIASMCVQPEVSHRPFMGEVVQALKLVCTDHFDDDPKLVGPASRDAEVRAEMMSSLTSPQSLHDVDLRDDNNDNDDNGDDGDNNNNNNNRSALLSSELLGAGAGAGPTGMERREMGSYRRHSSSGPLVTGQNRRFWQRLRSLSWGS